MKKIKVILGLLVAISYSGNAQVKSDDFGRIVLNTYLSEKLTIPTEARQLLQTKLSQMASDYGMSGSLVNPRFIITADVNINSKKIIAGPPQMVSQKVDITLFIGDVVSNTVFANTSLSTIGVGNNENTAFIDAFNNIVTKNNNIAAFMAEGKNKIISFYSSQCESTINEANSLVNQQKFNEAIFKLSLVPEVCQDCYLQCLDKTGQIYQQKIDAEGDVILNKARTAWLSAKNEEGAKNAYELLSTINPKATCQPKVAELYKTIETKLNADEKKQWDLTMKLYRDNLKLEESTLNAYRDVAVEYAKNQPKIINNTTILW